jgi:hypothetical protein
MLDERRVMSAAFAAPVSRGAGRNPCDSRVALPQYLQPGTHKPFPRLLRNLRPLLKPLTGRLTQSFSLRSCVARHAQILFPQCGHFGRFARGPVVVK